MFDVFGNMDSPEEINRTAEGLFNEGDMENIRLLAEENGLDPELTEGYIRGETPLLCDAMTAAIGKLEIEKKDKAVEGYNSRIPADPIADYLIGKCEEETFALRIRKKEKSLLGCLKYIEQEARKTVTRERPWLHDAAVYKMARTYYLQEEKR